MDAWQDVHLNLGDACGDLFGDGRAALLAALLGDTLCDSPGCAALDDPVFDPPGCLAGGVHGI